ncbi:MAG: SufE family protein [Bacteroidales bacterium]|nr:SufE family protein [Bacteroidales bacterium]
MTIDEKQQEIIEEFGLFDDWMDKYNYLIELSKDLPEMDPKNKTDDNLIEGCQSKVWLNAEMQDGKLVFTADSDAIITKGIIALLIQVLSGRNPKEIKDAKLYFIDEIGLKENLSPTRSNGLLAMVNKIKAYAMAYDLKQNQ